MGASGPIFAALIAMEELKKFKAHSCYKVNNDLKFAGMIEHSIKGNDRPKFAVGAFYNLAALNSKFKLKVTQDMTVSLSKKFEVAKGFTVLTGCKCDAQKKYTYGCQI